MYEKCKLCASAACHLYSPGAVACGECRWAHLEEGDQPVAQKTKKAKRGAAATPTVDQVHSLAPIVPCRSLRSLSQT